MAQWAALIVNAVAHRDYSIMGTDIQIKMFDDHFTVESPGTLPGLVRVNNIREYHFSRNPKIVELLNEYDLVKEFGEGIDRIYRDMSSAELPEPNFRESEFMFYATLRNKNWGKENVSWEEPEQVSIHDGIHDGIHDESKILQFCEKPKSRQEIMEFLQLVNRKNFVDRYLSPLLSEGKLIMTLPDKPKSKNQKYVASK